MPQRRGGRRGRRSLAAKEAARLSKGGGAAAATAGAGRARSGGGGVHGPGLAAIQNAYGDDDSDDVEDEEDVYSVAEEMEVEQPQVQTTTLLAGWTSEPAAGPMEVASSSAEPPPPPEPEVPPPPEPEAASAARTPKADDASVKSVTINGRRMVSEVEGYKQRLAADNVGKGWHWLPAPCLPSTKRKVRGALPVPGQVRLPRHV